MYRHFFKRLFDILLSFIGLIVISPILFVVTVWLYFTNKRAGAFFTQARPGKDAKIFKIIKFKTMTDEQDSEGNLLPDAKRLTKIGAFVRSCSIDEFPQLINIIKGDMSFIGPRPLTIVYLDYYTSEQSRRHDVMPGMTGWAQVNGRNLLLLSKKFEYDVWYVDNISLKLDIKIFFMTIVKILKRSDVGTGADNMLEVDDLNIGERIKNSKK